MKPQIQTALFAIGAVALLAFAVLVDLRTGEEVSVFPLYVAPLIFAAWFLDLRWGLWLSFAAMLARRWVNWHEGPSFSATWIFWQNGLSNLTVYVFIVFSFHTFKRGRRADRERIARLESALRVCPSCNRVQGGTPPARHLDELLHAQGATPPEKRLCPECASAWQDREPAI
jgi:hypothetical protein